jgi:hypothetical protein
MGTAELIAGIETAFPVLPLPGMTLRQAQLADHSIRRVITDDEWAAEGARDRGIPWTQISDNDLSAYDAALSHCDEEAFAYYLPAFLRFPVLHLADTSFQVSTVVGMAVFAVTHRSAYNLARLKKLTDAQIDVVTRFLRYVLENSRFMLWMSRRRSVNTGKLPIREGAH